MTAPGAVLPDDWAGDRPEEPTSDVHFGLVELDLLATHAGVPLPFPLRVPSFGRIPGEREVLLDVAAGALRQRGLADHVGPCGVAAEVVAALREQRGTVDLVVEGPDGTTAVVAIAYRSSALICEQSLPAEPSGLVRVRQVEETAVSRELAALVPAVPQARSMPIALPAPVVDGGTRLAAELAGRPELEQRLRELARDHGGDPDTLDQLARLLPELTGRGQLGATRFTTTGNVRAGTELSWLDGPVGRVRVHRTADGWVNVNPLRRSGLRSALDGLAAIARERR